MYGVQNGNDSNVMIPGKELSGIAIFTKIALSNGKLIRDTKKLSKSLQAAQL